MPVATKLQQLHVASSMEELDKHSTTPKNLFNTNLLMLCRSVKTILQKADMTKDSGDEEKAYTMYFRYFELVQHIRKHKDYKKDKDTYDKLIMLDQCTRVMAALEKLKESLIKRYSLMRESKEAEMKEQKAAEEAYAAQSRKAPDSKSSGVESKSSGPSTNSVGGVPAVPLAAGTVAPAKTLITSFELYDFLQDQSLNLLILDARPRDDYLESHLKHSHCISVPEEILQPGIIGDQLAEELPESSLFMFEKRDLVDFVILVDWRSKEVPTLPTVPLRVLRDAIWKWSPKRYLKSEPMVLEGGYEDWLLRYPMHTTYAHPRVPTPPKEHSEPDVTDTGLVDFPNLDEDFPVKPKEPQQDTDSSRSNSLVPLSSQGGVLFTPLVDRTKKPGIFSSPNVLGQKITNGTADQKDQDALGQQLLTPKVNRASKPASTAPGATNHDFDTGDIGHDGPALSDKKVASMAGALGQELLELTKEQLDAEHQFELLRERRTREAEEGIREALQEQEEALREKIRQTEMLIVERDQEVSNLTKSNLLFQQQLEEKDRELERITRLNEERRKADKEVQRLRDERKRKEQKEREEAEKRREASPAKNIAEKISMPARTRKPPSVGDVRDPGGQGEHTATPRNQAQTSWKSLSRSRSFPNLSTAMEEEEEDMSKSQLNASCVPQFNRALKPSQSVETSTVNLNRQSRIRTVDAPSSRYRSASPSSGQEFKRSAGLRNLGNTCYMNATLQCLANTIPLSMHFVSGRFQNDINRESKRGTGGEIANEFKSLVYQMHFNDKSIAPKSFKSLMGRLFSVYAGYEQQDAHEFLLNLIDKLHEDLNRAQRRGPTALLPAADEANLSLNGRINRFWLQHVDRHLSVISDLFEGLLVSSLTCLSCRKSSSSFEVFSCLSLPIPPHTGSTCHLQDCLKLFLETEKMSGEAAWDCPSCKQKRKAEKRMIIARLPKILIVQFNRFRCEAAWQSKKLQTNVQFPIGNFDMNSYVDHTKVETQRRPTYNLYAFLNHYGTLATGHYVAYCRAGLAGPWFMYDDASVTEVTLSDSDKKNAYILFYTSVDMRHQFTF